MAEALLTGAIQAPGFSGLNVQDSSVQLTSGYALEAFNCVIDKYGRIGARKGWKTVNTAQLSPAGNVRSIFELVKSDGNVTFSCANNKIYTGTTTLTAAVNGTVTNAAGTGTQAVTITGDNWQIAGMPYNNSGNTSSHVIFAQKDNPLLVYHKLPSAGSGATLTVSSVNGAGHVTGITVTTGGTNWYVGEVATVTGGSGSGATFTVTSVSGTAITGVSITSVGSGYTAGNVLTLVDTSPKHNHTGAYGFQRLADISTFPAGYTVSTFTPNCALTAYGRLWVANITNNEQTVYFSDLQNPSNFTTGTSGFLDISTVIPTGDGIVALAAHNGFFIIFCRRHIIIYANPKDPATMTLQDVIKGVGCIARDSVASVFGADLYFLSETGVQSLGRLIQEKSMPLRDISKNVRDELISNVANENLVNVKGIYVASESFYLLSLPYTGFTYCFDTRGSLENGAARTTIWKDINPTAFFVTEARNFYIGKAGYIGKYDGYLDNSSTYRFSYYTNYFDLDQPSTIKILKKLGMIVIGGGVQEIAVKWAFDYNTNYYSTTTSTRGGVVSEYGVGEYNIAEYSNGISLDGIKLIASGSGKILQLGFETDINGSAMSVQKIDIGLKIGKTL
jgi:hypothetical protein